MANDRSLMVHGFNLAERHGRDVAASGRKRPLVLRHGVVEKVLAVDAYRNQGVIRQGVSRVESQPVIKEVPGETEIARDRGAIDEYLERHGALFDARTGVQHTANDIRGGIDVGRPRGRAGAVGNRRRGIAVNRATEGILNLVFVETVRLHPVNLPGGADDGRLAIPTAPGRTPVVEIGRSAIQEYLRKSSAVINVFVVILRGGVVPTIVRDYFYARTFAMDAVVKALELS